MNASYYNTPIFPGTSLNDGKVPNQQSVPSYEANIFPSQAGSDEQSYIENILRLNKGKVGKFHITIPGSEDWRDKVFTGIIEQSGRDHIIVSNPNTGEWYLILMIYLDFVTFDESINFIKDFT